MNPTDCPNRAGFACPVGPACLGHSDPSACRQLEKLIANREQGPGLLAMGSGFLKAAAVQALAGNRIAPAEVIAQRKATCQACPLHTPDDDGCRSCGCKSRSWLPGIDLGLKRSWATQDCPEGYWLAVDPDLLKLGGV